MSLKGRVNRLEERTGGGVDIRVYLGVPGEPDVFVRRNNAGDEVERATAAELDARRGKDDTVIRVTADGDGDYR